MHRRIYLAVATVVATAFVFGPAALYAAGVRPEAFENRPLAPAPRLSEGWELFADIPPWAADRVPARKQVIETSAWIDYFVLGSLPRTGTGTSTASPGAPGTQKAPQVVRGRDGWLFLGEDFDSTCLAGGSFGKGLRNLARLADVIERSGRRVVFSVAPNKSAIYGDRLRRAIPHGGCARDGLVRQDRELDAFSHPHWLPVRKPLVAARARGDQVYWRTDTHWTTAGSSVYARELARRLRPHVAATRFEGTEAERLGDLVKLAGLTFHERADAAVSSRSADVRETASSSTYDPGSVVYDVNSWRTRPSRGALPGHTLLLGDSFTYYALPTLRPLFADGTFFWVLHSGDNEQLLRQVERSDTVVVQVVQRTMRSGSYPLLDPRFRRTVAARLGVEN